MIFQTTGFSWGLDGGVWRRLSQIGAVLVLATLPAEAGDGWGPTVTTTTRGDVLQRVSQPVPLPVWANPQVLTAKVWSAPPVVVEQTPEAFSVSPGLDGDWSNIITGALPEQAGEAAAKGSNRNTGEKIAADAPHDAASQAVAPRAPAVPAALATTKAPAASHAAEASPAAAQPSDQKAGGAPAVQPSGEGQDVITKAAQELPVDASPAQQYCFNTADSAADARFASQSKQIKLMEAELEKRVELLQQKTEEYKEWLAKRDDFARKAHDKLVGFYAKMKPDAAALQLTAMDEEAAAALLLKLEPKAASLILAEIEPTRAARIAAIISGAARVDRRAKAPAAQKGSAPASAPRQGGAASPPPPNARS